VFGATVDLEDDNSGAKATYQIVVTTRPI